MSWVTLMAPTLGARGLGSAQAGARWGWAEAPDQAFPQAPASRRAPSTAPTIASTPLPSRPAAMRPTGSADRMIGHMSDRNAPVSPATALYAEMAPTPAVAQSIAEAALLLGRDADDIWAEAAREWLGRHLGLVAIVADDANDDPPPTAPAAALATRRASRCWVAIDALLDDLRAPAA